MSMWKKYPDEKPIKSGYYITYYLNPDGKHYFKSHWFNSKMNKWVFTRFEPNVLAFIPESRNEYYVPCEMWANERVIMKPEWL